MGNSPTATTGTIRARRPLTARQRRGRHGALERVVVASALSCALGLCPLVAQTPVSAQSTKGTGVVGAKGTPPAGVTPPPDYVIGPDDVLTVVFWRDKDMSGDVTVRPDGKITLPLVNEVTAAGLTPEQLRVNLTELAGKLI